MKQEEGEGIEEEKESALGKRIRVDAIDQVRMVKRIVTKESEAIVQQPP